MALTTDFLDLVSAKAALLGILIGLVLYVAALRADEYIRINRIGSRGMQIRTYLPFGKCAPLQFTLHTSGPLGKHLKVTRWLLCRYRLRLQGRQGDKGAQELRTMAQVLWC
jgi:hypothetical protein